MTLLVQRPALIRISQGKAAVEYYSGMSRK
jgi:hypothetical protein